MCREMVLGSKITTDQQFLKLPARRLEVQYFEVFFSLEREFGAIIPKILSPDRIATTILYRILPLSSNTLTHLCSCMPIRGQMLFSG
ncbi:hypothetical protein C8R32_10256 [Nitrosospira sp. Nsp5]|nr:hypothetical protein C8R32_10256 [Nitrosospira sp. Nsp5]